MSIVADSMRGDPLTSFTRSNFFTKQNQGQSAMGKTHGVNFLGDKANNNIKPSASLKFKRSTSKFSIDDDGRIDEASLGSMASTKDRLRGHQAGLKKMSPNDITKILQEQVYIRKSPEYKESITTYKHIKLDVEDRYSDEGELDTPMPLEVDSVRNLDKWQLENKKKKIISIVQKKNDSIGKELSQKPQNDGFNPFLNQEIINFITKGEDFEDLVAYYRNRPFAPNLTARTQSEADHDPKALTEGPGDGTSEYHKVIKGIESQKRDRNREILNELVFLKLKQKYAEMLEGINRADLTAQIKIISDETMNNFLALKGLSSVGDVTNLQKITARLIKKKQEADKLNAFSEDIGINKQEQREKEQSTVEYKVVEQALIKKFEDCENEIQKIRTKMGNLNHDNFLLRQMHKTLLREKDEKLAQFDDMENKIASERNDKGSGISRRPGIYDRGNLEDYMKLQRVRNDRKKCETEYNEKIQEVESNLAKNQEVVAQQDSEMLNMKNLKAHYKLQLKDLYQRVLKEENDLLKPDNNTNYLRVVVSLMRISDEVMDHLLPSFLDKDAVNYVLEWARTQYRMEQYCKENGLANLLDNLEGEKSNETKLPAIQSPRLFAEDSKQTSILSRDFQSSLGDIKDKLKLLKKMEIKAKKTVILPSPKRQKEKIIKEESVDLLRPEDYEKLSPREDKLSPKPVRRQTTLNSSMGMGKAGIDYVTEQIGIMDTMKKNEIARIFKQHMPKNIEERSKTYLMKTFRYLFGKREGEELFMKFMKDKKMYDQKMQKANNAGGGIKKFSAADEKMSKLMQMKLSMTYNPKLATTLTNISNNESMALDAVARRTHSTRNQDSHSVRNQDAHSTRNQDLPAIKEMAIASSRVFQF